MEKYVKVKPLGKGSFGAAVLIRRREDGMHFVVKEVNIAKMGPKEREEARNEVRVLQQLSHPNIVRYVEHFEKSGVLYIVMEYADGGDLHSKIKEQRNMRMKEETVMHYFAQLCLAMEYLHSRHILHRDIKTMNIFLTSNGTVKLGDFGISTVLRNTMGMANTVCGTPYYFSPELCHNKPYNNRSDVWAIGVVLYELAMLKHPFDGNSMNQLMQRIVRSSYPPIPSTYSKELRELLAACLRKDPKQRPNIRQLLCLDIVRNALERLEHNLMMATQARVRLQNVVAEEMEGIEKQRAAALVAAAERERMRKENELKHAELQKKLAAMGVPKSAAQAVAAPQVVVSAPKKVAVGPGPTGVQHAAPAPLGAPQRKPALPSAAGRNHGHQHGIHAAGAAAGHGGRAHINAAVVAPVKAPVVVANYDAMKPIEDFIAQLDQPVEKRIHDVMERQRRQQEAERAAAAAAAEAARQQRERELQAMLKLHEDQMRVIASKNNNNNADPRAAVQAGAGGGAVKGANHRRVSPQRARPTGAAAPLMPLPKAAAEAHKLRAAGAAAHVPPLHHHNMPAKAAVPRQAAGAPAAAPKAGSDPQQVARAQNWVERQNEEKRRAALLKGGDRRTALEEERRAVAAMDDQVFRGMQNRVVDPALEAWVQRELHKGNIAAAPAVPQAPAVSNARDDIPAGVAHRRALGIDLGEGASGSSGASTGSSASTGAVRRSIDAVDRVFREHGIVGAPAPPAPPPLPPRREVNATDKNRMSLASPTATSRRHRRSMSECQLEHLPAEFMDAPLLQRSPLHLKDKGPGVPIVVASSRQSQVQPLPFAQLDAPVAAPPGVVDPMQPEPPASGQPRVELWARRASHQLVNAGGPALDIVNLSGSDQPARVMHPGGAPIGGGGGGGGIARKPRDRSAPPILRTPVKEDATRRDFPTEPLWITPELLVSDENGVAITAGVAVVPAAGGGDGGARVTQPVDVKQRNAEYQDMMSHIHTILASPLRQSQVPLPGAASDGGAYRPTAAAPQAQNSTLAPSAVPRSGSEGGMDDIVDTTEDDFGDDAPLTPLQPGVGVSAADSDEGGRLHGGKPLPSAPGSNLAGDLVDEEVLFRLAHLCGDSFDGSQPRRLGGEPLFGSRRLQGLERAECLRQHLEHALGIENFALAYETLAKVGVVGIDDCSEQLAVDSAKEFISTAIRAAQMADGLGFHDGADESGDGDDDAFIKRSAEMQSAVLDENAIEELAEEYLALICQLIFFDEEVNAKQYVQVKRFL